MIIDAKQDGDKFRITDEKGKNFVRRGYLVSASETRISYICDKFSKNVVVMDDKGHYVHSYNVTKQFESGVGW